MTLGQVKESTGAISASYAQKFLQDINDTCDKFEINTSNRQLCFLAQLGHESGGLFYTEELASGNAYENRADLGNTQTGDGVKFKGRGLIQITGRANYKSLSDAFGADFINSPTLLGGKNINVCTPDQLKFAAMSAGWFWSTHNLNVIADKINLATPIDEDANLVNFKNITRSINGGYNGLSDRITKFKVGVRFF